MPHSPWPEPVEGRPKFIEGCKAQMRIVAFLQDPDAISAIMKGAGYQTSGRNSFYKIVKVDFEGSIRPDMSGVFTGSIDLNRASQGQAYIQVIPIKLLARKSLGNYETSYRIRAFIELTNHPPVQILIYRYFWACLENMIQAR